jgi:hypothetical protein
MGNSNAVRRTSGVENLKAFHTLHGGEILYTGIGGLEN